MAKVHHNYHDFIVSTITAKIKKKFKPRRCKPAKQLTGADKNLTPDIYTETDRQTFDFTFSCNAKTAYTEKISKYEEAHFVNTVIPIVVTPWINMHSDSLR